MSRFVKELEMNHLRRRMEGVEDVVFVNVVGMEALESNELRLELRKRGIEMQVVKNSLARKVLADMGYPPVDGILEGPSAIAWGGEGIVELAREISEWAKKVEKLQVKGACVSGQAVDAQGVDVLSKLPSRVELIGQVVGMLLGAGSAPVAMINNVGAQLASQIEKLAEREGGGE